MLQFTSNSQCVAEALYYSLHNNEELCMSDDYQVWGAGGPADPGPGDMEEEMGVWKKVQALWR